MATHVIGDYTAANSIDGSTNYLLIQPGNSSTAYKKINRNTLLGVSGQPADISSSQNITNKTLDSTNTITLKDSLFTLQDDSDATKQAQFQLSGITTGTTRTYTLPNASSTLVDISSSQTLTNKTLTAPVINNGSITGTTITTDSIVGQSAGTSGTVYGLAVATSKISGASITNATIPTAAIADTAVTPAKLQSGTGTSWATTDYSGSATVVGWSSTTTKQIRYIQTGKIVNMFLYITGTSNSTATTVSLPVAPRTTLTFYEGAYGLAEDNTSFKTAAPRYTIDNSSGTATVVSFYPDTSGSNWTASGTKAIRAMVQYEAA